MLLLLRKVISATVLVFEQLLAFAEWPAPPKCQPTFLCPFWRAESVQFAQSITWFLLVEHILTASLGQKTLSPQGMTSLPWCASGWRVWASRRATSVWSSVSVGVLVTKPVSSRTRRSSFLSTFQQKLVKHLEQAAFGAWSRTCQFKLFCGVFDAPHPNPVQDLVEAFETEEYQRKFEAGLQIRW